MGLPSPTLTLRSLGVIVEASVRLKWSHEAGAFVDDQGKTIHDIDFEAAREQYLLYADSAEAQDYKNYIQEQAEFEEMCVQVQRYQMKKKK